jgi:hypothetical protein
VGGACEEGEEVETRKARRGNKSEEHDVGRFMAMEPGLSHVSAAAPIFHVCYAEREPASGRTCSII